MFDVYFPCKYILPRPKCTVLKPYVLSSVTNVLIVQQQQLISFKTNKSWSLVAAGCSPALQKFQTVFCCLKGLSKWEKCYFKFFFGVLLFFLVFFFPGLQAHPECLSPSLSLSAVFSKFKVCKADLANLSVLSCHWNTSLKWDGRLLFQGSSLMQVCWCSLLRVSLIC